MAIKNTLLGGTDWGNEGLSFGDLNDTFDAAVTAAEDYTDQESGMKLLGSAVLASPATSVSVSGLDGSEYITFMVRWIGKTDATTGTGSLYLRLNNDSSALYYTNSFTQTSTTLTGANVSADNEFGAIATLDDGADSVSSGTVDIIMASGVFPTAIQSKSAYSRGATTANQLVTGGIYYSTAEITQITLIMIGGGTLEVGTQMYVYGLKKS